MDTELKTTIKFILNNSETELSVNPSITLLDVLRKQLNFTGTKEGCREGDCGACTVLLGELINDNLKYISVNSCLLPIYDVNGKHVVTIEGLNEKSLNPIQTQFVEEGASQCGFCTPGFIVSLTGFFLSNKSNYDVVDSLDGNICRCTGHQSIITASKKVSEKVIAQLLKTEERIVELIRLGIIPEYFTSIKNRLKNIFKNELEVKKETALKISGGTDLYVKSWEDIYNSEATFLSSKNISSTITEKDGKCFIGAKVSVTDFIESPSVKKYFPQLTEKLKLFGSLPIRNRATIGGNIVNASPIADMVNILLALDSSITISHQNNTRIISLKDFYKGYKAFDLNDKEIIENVIFESPRENYFFNYEKVSKRTYLDIASVNTSIYLELKSNVINKIHLSAGGVAPIPLYLTNTCNYLSGKEITSENIKTAISIVQKEITPISDARGSAKYKSLLLRQLLYAHFITLFPDRITIKEVA